MRKLVWRIPVLLVVVSILAIVGHAEAAYTWEDAFPQMPTLEHHAYRAAVADIDVNALVDQLWPGEWTSDSFGEEGSLYTLDASKNPRGKFRERIEVYEGTISYYWDYGDKMPKQKDIGGYDTALTSTESFLLSWLPSEMLAHPLPSYGSFDEDGNTTDQYYELRWAQEVEPGIRAQARNYAEAVRANCYSYGVSLVVINWQTFTPADEDVRNSDYITAEKALESLNYAANNLGKKREYSSLNGNNRIVAVDPAFSDVFSEDGLFTFCWAFSVQDAQKGTVQAVLVNATTGEVFDGRIGRIDGMPN